MAEDLHADFPKIPHSPPPRPPSASGFLPYYGYSRMALNWCWYGGIASPLYFGFRPVGYLVRCGGF